MSADLGTIHSASMFLELQGDNAVAEARRLASEMRGRGDLDGADSWLKIIVAIEEMRRQRPARPS